MPIQRIPFAQPIESRDGDLGSQSNANKDSFTKNVFFDTVGNDRFVQKRPCCNVVPPLFTSYFTGCTVLAFRQVPATFRGSSGTDAYVVVNDYLTGTKTGVWYVSSNGDVNQVNLLVPYTPVNPALFQLSAGTVMLADVYNGFILKDGAKTFDVSPYMLSSFTISNAGSGYFSPTLTLSPLNTPIAAGVLAVAGSTGANVNKIVSATVVTQGSPYPSYTGTPSVTVGEAAVTLTITTVVSSTQFIATWSNPLRPIRSRSIYKT
jgi:hypothetical protein